MKALRSSRAADDVCRLDLLLRSNRIHQKHFNTIALNPSRQSQPNDNNCWMAAMDGWTMGIPLTGLDDSSASSFLTRHRLARSDPPAYLPKVAEHRTRPGCQADSTNPYSHKSTAMAAPAAATEPQEADDATGETKHRWMQERFRAQQVREGGTIDGTVAVRPPLTNSFTHDRRRRRGSRPGRRRGCRERR